MIRGAAVLGLSLAGLALIWHGSPFFGVVVLVLAIWIITD